MRSFGPRTLRRQKPAARPVAEPPPDTPAPAKPRIDFATRQRQLGEERRVLDQLRTGPKTYDEVHSTAALSRLVQAGVVRHAGFRRAPGRRGGEEKALFALVEMGG